jgi:hypothetical protein
MKFRLDFSGGSISGGGSDVNGKFTMHGTYDPQTHAVVVRKRYMILTVVYNGVWNGQFVAGTSVIGPAMFGERGSFEMWPESEESGFGAVEEISTEIDRPEPVPV